MINNDSRYIIYILVSDYRTSRALFSKEAIGLNRQIKSLRASKLKFAAKLKKALKLNENPTFQKAIQNFTSAALIFTMLQFREINKEKMGRRFTKKEKILSLALYKQGPKAYRWLRRIFVLPSPITLSRMISRAALMPGLNDRLFQQLKHQTKKMNEMEKACILMFDEMALKPHFDYNKKKDKIIGFVNNGFRMKSQIADHALVFMIRGIYRNYKQPICYTFCSGSTSTEELVMLLTCVIKKLKETGFNVVATVCDQGASNVSAINHLVEETKRNHLRNEEEYNKYVFKVDGEEIIPLFDPPHLIKGIRNNLINKDLKYVMEQKDKTAKWAHLMQLYEENPAYKGIRLMPKLTENHINPKKILKMKVKCATQVFSRSVAINMGYLAGQYQLFCHNTYAPL